MAIAYRLLRFWLKQAIDLYFVDIQVSDRQHAPRRGPVVFASNHPNSIMDTFVLGAQVDRPIRYLARSGLFKNPLLARVFDAAGALPVYRRDDPGTLPGDNEATFRAVFEALGRGEAIGIFPEGRNAPERHVREIRTGAARIALGAEAMHDFELGVQLVPVGLNFEDRDRFLTRVLVRFGAPIDVRTYVDAYRDDAKACTRELTLRLQDEMRALAVHLDDERHTELVRDIHRIYGGQLLEQRLGQAPDMRPLDTKLVRRVIGRIREHESLEDRFTVKQWIADAVDFYARTSPAKLEAIRDQIARYKAHVGHLRLPEGDEPSAEALSIRKEAVRAVVYGMALGPIALWGFVHHILPARIALRVSKRAPDEAMRALWLLLSGLVLLPIFYGVYGCWAWHATESAWTTAGYLLTLPAAGFWVLRYRARLRHYARRVELRSAFLNHRNSIRLLALEQRRLVASLDRLRLAYERSLQDNK